MMFMVAGGLGLVPFRPEQQQQRLRLSLSPEETIDSSATRLSESFGGATEDAASALGLAVDEGLTLLRLDFDPSLGDATYTTLKSSMEFVRSVGSIFARRYTKENETICFYFPDAGAAASAAQQWKVGTEEALVPSKVRLAAFPRDAPRDTDAAFVLVCPRASEAASAEKLVDDVARLQLKPTILVNPELVDMQSTGFGFAGRRLKQRLLDDFNTVYYLKTLPWGALAMTYPKRYSVYQEDQLVDGGYKLIDIRDSLPNGDDLEEIYEAYQDTLKKENKIQDDGLSFDKLASQFSKFADQFSKL